MLDALYKLALFMLTNPVALSFEVPVLADAWIRLSPKLNQIGLTSHRWQYFRDSLPSLVALAKSILGHEDHPRVIALLEAAAKAAEQEKGKAA